MYEYYSMAISSLYDKMRSAMDFVRDHHTYVSRLKTMFSILD